MDGKAQFAAVLVAGYLLGRTKKMKLALTVAGAIGGRQILHHRGDLISRASRVLDSSPQARTIAKQVRTSLLEAATGAAVTAASRGIGSLSDSLQERAEKLRARKAEPGDAELGDAELENEGPEDEDAELEDEEPEAPASEDDGDKKTSRRQPERRQSGSGQPGSASGSASGSRGGSRTGSRAASSTRRSSGRSQSSSRSTKSSSA